MPKLRTLHRSSALLIALFVTVHIINHVVGLAGPGAHMRYMAGARPFYRNALIEPLLLGLLLWQAASGATLIGRGWRARRGLVAWLQAGSGLYLLSFLFIHTGAVLYARAHGIDTDVRFAAAGFHVPGWPWFFAPYYSIAIMALFTHVGCALFWHVRRRRELVLASFVTAGAGLGIAVVLSLALG